MRMRKLLLWLLGLLLMGILAYFCFMDRSDGIKKHLVSEVQTAYANEKMDWVHADLKGNGLDMRRTMMLEGTAPSVALKEKAALIAAGIAGVATVENNLKVPQEALSQKAIAPEENMTKQEPLVMVKSVEEIVTPYPYTFQAKKNKEGIVTLTGYVLDTPMHEAVVDKAEVLFGEKNVVDRLKEAKGALAGWDGSIRLGLEKLAEVEYGALSMSGTDFKFNGYMHDAEKKEQLLEGLKQNLDGRYLGHYALDAPDKKPEVAVKKPVRKPTVLKEAKKQSSVEKKVLKNRKNALLCEKKFKKIMRTGKVHFAYNRAGIKPESFSLLNAIVAASKECPSEVIMIGGHTDSIGSAEYNKILSAKRANSVKKYLVSEGVDAKRIEAKGFGESHPIADNMHKAGRAKNRRIEISIKGVQK